MINRRSSFSIPSDTKENILENAPCRGVHFDWIGRVLGFLPLQSAVETYRARPERSLLPTSRTQILMAGSASGGSRCRKEGGSPWLLTTWGWKLIHPATASVWQWVSCAVGDIPFHCWRSLLTYKSQSEKYVRNIPTRATVPQRDSTYFR